MTRRAVCIDRDASGAIDFDADLEAYFEPGDAEELLRAAALVLGSTIPLDEAHADTIAALTSCTCDLADYDDAGRAVRRWFATMAEPGARHRRLSRVASDQPGRSQWTALFLSTCKDGPA
jgi:hypothetical protein